MNVEPTEIETTVVPVTLHLLRAVGQLGKNELSVAIDQTVGYVNVVSIGKRKILFLDHRVRDRLEGRGWGVATTNRPVEQCFLLV